MLAAIDTALRDACCLCLGNNNTTTLRLLSLFVEACRFLICHSCLVALSVMNHSIDKLKQLVGGKASGAVPLVLL